MSQPFTPIPYHDLLIVPFLPNILKFISTMEALLDTPFHTFSCKLLA